MHYIALGTALLLSSIAAGFSVVGMTAIFSASPYAVGMMATALELAKIVSAVYVHRFWHQLSIALKTYLFIAIVLLMGITSVGVFGFLSDAHLVYQAHLDTGVNKDLKLLDLQIKSEEDALSDLQIQLDQVDKPAEKALELSQKSYEARKAADLRDSSKKSRIDITKQMTSHRQALTQLEGQKVDLDTKRIEEEAKAGPIKYVAQFIFGNPSRDQLETVVRWLIIILIISFDPLAIVLLLSTNIRYRDDLWASHGSSISSPDLVHHVLVPKKHVVIIGDEGENGKGSAPEFSGEVKERVDDPGSRWGVLGRVLRIH